MRRIYPSDVLNEIVEEDVEQGELPSWIEVEASIHKDSSSKRVRQAEEPIRGSGGSGGKRPKKPPIELSGVAESDAHFFRFKYEFLEPLPPSFVFAGEKQGANGKYYSVFSSGVRLERNRESIIVYITRLNTEDNAFRAMRLALMEAMLVREELLERYPVLQLSSPSPVTEGHFELFDPVARALYDQGEVKLPHRTPETEAQYDASPRPGMIGFRSAESAERFRKYRRETFGDNITVDEANAYADNALALRVLLEESVGLQARSVEVQERLAQEVRLQGSVTEGQAFRSMEMMLARYMDGQRDFLEKLGVITSGIAGRNMRPSRFLALDITLYNAWSSVVGFVGRFADKFINKFNALRHRRKRDDGREGGLRRLAGRLKP